MVQLHQVNSSPHFNKLTCSVTRSSLPTRHDNVPAQEATVKGVIRKSSANLHKRSQDRSQRGPIENKSSNERNHDRSGRESLNTISRTSNSSTKGSEARNRSHLSRPSSRTQSLRSLRNRCHREFPSSMLSNNLWQLLVTHKKSSRLSLKASNLPLLRSKLMGVRRPSMS